MGAGNFRLLEHTADIGIEARGASLESLLEQAAYGLRAVMAEQIDLEPAEELLLKLSGDDLEELLVNWLNELLFLFETRGFLPARVIVEEAGRTQLRARIKGERYDPQRHQIDREIKAVTYHQISVTCGPKGWQARVYLDL